MIATETLAKPARKALPDEAPHVLVVDDDRRLRELLARFLGDNGYRVTTAANAAEADTRLGEPAAVRYFLNWFDDTPRDEMRRQLLAEVNRALAERFTEFADEAARVDDAAAAA